MKRILMLGFAFVLISCSGGEDTTVTLDPDYLLLRDNLPQVSSCKALHAYPSWGRGTWSPELFPSTHWLVDHGPSLAPVPPGLDSEEVDLSIDPESRTINGSATIQILTKEPTGVVYFSLTAAQAEVTAADPPAALWSYEDGVLEVVAQDEIPQGQTWTIEVQWSDENVEQVQDLFPEGGGSVLANLISKDSTFFTFGYDFWPKLRPLGILPQVLFRVTFPSDLTLVMSGERTDNVNNSDGTRTETWSVDFPTMGNLGLALAKYDVAEGSCGDAKLEIYARPGKSIDDYPIVPGTYIEGFQKACDYYVSLFGQPAVSTIRFAGVDERFTNGYATPGLVLVPNYIWDDDGTGSFTERDFYLAHELSHTWWGNDVFLGRMKDVWLIEGMADWAGCNAVGEMEDEEHRTKIWIWEVSPFINWLYTGGDDQPVVSDDLDNLKPVVYYVKGAWVLRMLQSVVGDEKMAQIVGQFRQAHGFSVMSTEEFTSLAAQVYGKDLDWFFEQWLNGKGVMSLRQSNETTDDGVEVTVEQLNSWAGDSQTFYEMPLVIRARRAEQSSEQEVHLSKEKEAFFLSWN